MSFENFFLSLFSWHKVASAFGSLLVVFVLIFL